MIRFTTDNKPFLDYLNITNIGYIFDNGTVSCKYHDRFNGDITISIDVGDEYNDKNAGVAFAKITKMLIDNLYKQNYNYDYYLSMYILPDPNPARKIQCLYNQLCDNTFIRFIDNMPYKAEMQTKCFCYIRKHDTDDELYNLLLNDDLINGLDLMRSAFTNGVLLNSWIGALNKVELYYLYRLLIEGIKK